MFSGGARLFELVFTIDKLQHGLSSTSPRSFGVCLTDSELLTDETSSSSRLSGNFEIWFSLTGCLDEKSCAGCWSKTHAVVYPDVIVVTAIVKFYMIYVL